MDNQGFEGLDHLRLESVKPSHTEPSDTRSVNGIRFECGSPQCDQDDAAVERPSSSSPPPPPVFRPRRLLNNISHSLASKTFHNIHWSPTSSMHADRITHHAIWHPMRTLVNSVHSISKPKGQCMENDTHQQEMPSPPELGHCGRFNIGHPTTCDANIDDDPDTNRRAKFVSTPTSQLAPSEFSDAILDDTLYNTTTSSRAPVTRRRKPHIYMDDDFLGRDSYSFTKSNRVLVRINISGERFHVLHSTLQKDPYVYSKMLEDAVWLPEAREYYFERDPTVFRFIHNYLRYGEVHLPTGFCGPLLEKELDEWGIPLGLDIQRCCLGPVISSKFKVGSLRKFERHLEPEFIKPSYWIQSPRWQALRAKVWQVLDVSPRVSRYHLTNHRNSTESNALSMTSRYDSPYHKPSVSDDELDDDEDADDDTAHNAPVRTSGERVSHNLNLPFQAPTIRPPPRSGEGLSHLLTIQPRLIISSLSKREKFFIRWGRRLYVAYETLIVTAAVVVFMLSTLEQYRVPIKTASANTGPLNSSGRLSDAISAMLNQVTVDMLTNETRISLPIQSLVNIDIFFSVTITIDVLARMVFCPALRPWLFTVYTLIDILSLVPFYCELILYEMIYYNAFVNANDWLVWLMNIEGYVVILKVFVVLRLFRVLRRHRGTRVLLYTIRTTFLDMCIIVVLILVAALFFGAAIYFTDDNFHNIPSGFWWALVTMSTVGYGDMVPTHVVGYAVAMICVILGTLLMSYTIPILVNHFILYYDHADQLSMVKQLHRSAKRKARSRTMSKYAQKALASARCLMNATLTNAVAKVNSTIQVSSRTMEVKYPSLEKKRSASIAAIQAPSE